MHWKIFDRLSNFVATVGGLSLVALIVIMGYQVWGRYVLNNTPTWAESLALLLILLVSLPIAAIGLRENFHLGINFVTDRLPAPIQKGLQMLNTIILLLFGLAMTWHSWELVSGTWNRLIPLVGLPQGVRYLPLTICGVLIVLFMVERLFSLLKTGRIAPNETKEGEEY